MPNRLIKESICTSETLARLNDFQENFFYRLIVAVDDYGRFDARPSILRARLYPLRERLTLRDVESALQALADAGCVEVYRVDGKPYLHLPTWGVHQRIRNKLSKYPQPPEEGLQQNGTDSLSIDSKPPSTAAVIQSNPNPNPESNPNGSAEPQADSTPAFITLTLNTGEEWPVEWEMVEEWKKLYPAVDILQQLRKMRGWLLSNESNRKTKRGIKGFINRWLSREQDKGGARKENGSYGTGSTVPAPAAGNSAQAQQWDLDIIDL